MLRWFTYVLAFVGVAILLNALAGCEQAPPTTTVPSSAAPTAEDRAAVERRLAQQPSAATDPAAGLPPGHPPIGPGDTTGPSAGPLDGAELQYTAPPRWVSQPPATPMRRAQFLVPRAEGDTADGLLTVSHFPRTGGSTQANLDRWIGQFSQQDGSPVPRDSATFSTFEANGLKVSTVDVTGYFFDSNVMGGSGKRTETPYRLLGGIVEMPNGAWFFKLTGPEATVTAARDEFMDLLKSVHP